MSEEPQYFHVRFVALIASLIGFVAAVMTIFGFATNRFTLDGTSDWVKEKFGVVRPRVYAPPQSIITDGRCPGEGGCLFGEWNVTKDTQLFQHPDALHPVGAGMVTRGSVVQGVTAQMMTTHPERIRVREGNTSRANDEVEFKVARGDELLAYVYLGEGCWRIWYEGALRVLCTDVEVVEEPAMTWWVQVQTQAGARGWSNEPSNFCGVTRYDECGRRKNGV